MAFLLTGARAVADREYRDAQVNELKAAGAPSGSFGVGFFGNDTFSYPKFLVEYLAADNPRL